MRLSEELHLLVKGSSFVQLGRTSRYGSSEMSPQLQTHSGLSSCASSLPGDRNSFYSRFERHSDTIIHFHQDLMTQQRWWEPWRGPTLTQVQGQAAQSPRHGTNYSDPHPKERHHWDPERSQARGSLLMLQRFSFWTPFTNIWKPQPLRQNPACRPFICF